jgi:hypothetical protein
MDVNAYLLKTYGPQPCWELVADVYASELQALAVDYKTVNRSVRQMASAFRLAIHKSAHGFVQVSEPVDFAIVLLGKTPEIGVHHCGVWYGGKVLHAMTGITMHEELSVIRDKFALVEFWAKP